MCSSPRRATVIPRGRRRRGGGDGGLKGGNFREGEGLLSEVFFSVEQAKSILHVTDVALFIFHLRSAKCFFHG